MIRRAALQLGHVLDNSSAKAVKRGRVATLYRAYYRSKPDLFIHDLRVRPQHYSEAHIATIRRLEAGEEVPEQQITELILHHQKPTAEKKPQARAQPQAQKTLAKSPPKPPAQPEGPVKRLKI